MHPTKRNSATRNKGVIIFRPTDLNFCSSRTLWRGHITNYPQQNINGSDTSLPANISQHPCLFFNSRTPWPVWMTGGKGFWDSEQARSIEGGWLTELYEEEWQN